MSKPQKLQGYMYLAKRQCGKVVAAAWDDEGYKKDTAESVARWIKRGDSVQRIARYVGDPQPDWACNSGEPCPCKDTPAAQGDAL